MSGLAGRGVVFAAGVGVGVYGMVKARRVQEALTPDGLRDRGRSLALGARMLRQEVAQARTHKESELRDRMGLPSAAPLPGRSANPAVAPPAQSHALSSTDVKQIERGQH